MVCQTVKAGIECAFMTKKGCGFNGGTCNAIIDKCEGCGKIIESSFGRFCTVYPDPAAKWSHGSCRQLSDRHSRQEGERRGIAKN